MQLHEIDSGNVATRWRTTLKPGSESRITKNRLNGILGW